MPKKIQFRCAVASVAKSKKSLFLIRHNNTLQLACKYHYTVHISHGPLKLWKKKSQTNGILNANGIFSHSFANEAILLLRDFHQAATLTKNAYLQQYEYCIAKDTLLRESHDLYSKLKYSEIIQWWSMCKQLTTAIVLALAASKSKKKSQPEVANISAKLTNADGLMPKRK